MEIYSEVYRRFFWNVLFRVLFFEISKQIFGKMEPMNCRIISNCGTNLDKLYPAYEWKSVAHIFLFFDTVLSLGIFDLYGIDSFGFIHAMKT